MALLEGLLDEAAAAGGIQSGLNHRRIAGVLLQAIMFNAFASTISGTSVRADPRGGRRALGPRARRHRHPLTLLLRSLCYSDNAILRGYPWPASTISS